MTNLEQTLANMTKAELMTLARAAGLTGRSSMTRDQLRAALADHLAAPRSHTGPSAGPQPADERCSRRAGDHRCGLPALSGGELCALHGADLRDEVQPIAGRLGFDQWPALLRQLRLATYDTDPLGLDPVIAEMAWHVANLMYHDYFRVTVSGAQHVPAAGAGVLAANHAGAALPWDALMLSAAVANEPDVPRRLRLIGTEIFNMLPFVSHLYRKSGGAYASRSDAMWILDQGYLLGVFPEGVAGFQKAQKQAYQTQRFGRGGFADLAMRAGAPIVPVAIVGSEETHPVVFTSARLARLVRLVFPEQRVDELAVWLNLIPLPVKWHIEFLEPIDVGAATDRPDRLAVLEIAEEVRSRVQAALDRLVSQRRSIF